MNQFCSFPGSITSLFSLFNYRLHLAEGKRQAYYWYSYAIFTYSIFHISFPDRFKDLHTIFQYYIIINLPHLCLHVFDVTLLHVPFSLASADPFLACILTNISPLAQSVPPLAIFSASISPIEEFSTWAENKGNYKCARWSIKQILSKYLHISRIPDVFQSLQLRENHHRLGRWHVGD